MQFNPPDAPVIISVDHAMMTIMLNRPKAINSLTLEMIRLMRGAMEKAESAEDIRLVLFTGAGEKGFCAGADVKAAVKEVEENRKQAAMRFFIEEYALDLCIHRFKKPVIALAHGITMGGGLGLTAGADLVMATETTRMAMPETRIGFFPDVGATGWLFHKCPKGYAEYLGLTGQELSGIETVRLGLSHGLVLARDLPRVIEKLKSMAKTLPRDKQSAMVQIKENLQPLFHASTDIKPDPADQSAADQWVKDTFYGRSSISEIFAILSEASSHPEHSKAALSRLAERSPTATVLTLQLLRQNENLPLEKVFAAETKATDFIISHPDYREGVRARLIDKDNTPRWQPDQLEKASGLRVDIAP